MKGKLNHLNNLNLNNERAILNIYFILPYCTGGRKKKRKKNEKSPRNTFPYTTEYFHLCLAFSILSINADDITESNIMARYLIAE